MRVPTTPLAGLKLEAVLVPGWLLEVFGREEHFVRWNTPIDIECGVVEFDTVLGLGVVWVVTFVSEDGDWAEDSESVSKAAWDKELFFGFGVKEHGTSDTASRGVWSDVDRDVEDLSMDDANEFGLFERRFLEMEAAHGTVVRERFVILAEIVMDTAFSEISAVPGFEEISSIIAVDIGLDEDDVREFWDG